MRDDTTYVCTKQVSRFFLLHRRLRLLQTPHVGAYVSSKRPLCCSDVRISEERYPAPSSAPVSGSSSASRWSHLRSAQNPRREVPISAIAYCPRGRSVLQGLLACRESRVKRITK